MATAVRTSPNADATAAFNGRHLDRTQDGTLWAVQVGSGGASGLYLTYSKDSGATWTPVAAVLTQAVRSPSLFIDLDDFAHLVYRDGSDGFIKYLRGTPNAARTAWTWSTAVDLGGGATAYDLPDVVAHREGTGWVAHVVASHTNPGPGNNVMYSRLAITSGQTISATGPGFIGTNYGVNAATYPSIDFNHTGDGKTVAGGAPHLYVGWSSGGSQNSLRFRKAVYGGGAWTWNAERVLDQGLIAPPYVSDTSAGNWQQTFFDGTRVTTVIVGSAGNNNDGLHFFERDAADTTTTHRVVLNWFNGSTNDLTRYLWYGSASYDSAGNVYVFGRDQSGGGDTRKVNWRKWNRATATLGPINTFDATGNHTPYISAKRGHSAGSIDYAWTDGAGPYTVQFDRVSLNVAPNAPTGLVPASGSVDRTSTQRFSWTFNDPDQGDTQSKYDLRWRAVGATSWATSTVQTTSRHHDFAGGTFVAGDYEWQVRTYDAQGVVGPYSSSAFFNAATPPPGPTITAPVNNQTIGSQAFTLLWSVSAQDAYEVRTVADSDGTPATGTVYTSTGTVESATARSRTVTFDTNQRQEHVQVRVRSAGLWSPWTSVRVLVSYTPPATPGVLPVPNDATAAISVIISHPTPAGDQPVVVGSDLFRREAGQGAGIRLAVGVGGSHVDRTPASLVDYEYGVLAYGSNGTYARSAEWIVLPPQSAGTLAPAAVVEPPIDPPAATAPGAPTLTVSQTSS